MQAVILVGGRGTRLGSLTAGLPKPMMAIGNKSFILYLIEEAARHGFKDILLLCGHLAEKIYSVFDGQIVKGARLRCVVEDVPMGTGGALLQASDQLASEFLLLNGDSLFDFNLNDLVTLADGDNWVGKVALRSLEDTGRFGNVTVLGDRVTSFAEKSGSGPGLINGGVYLLRREVLNFITVTPCSLERDVLPSLVARGLLYGRAYNGYFIDIGIPEELERARREIPSRRRPALFFDRDGVLNQDDGYVYRPEDFDWIVGAIEAIKLLNDRGWLVIVVTNQAGIARGYYPEGAVDNLHDWMQDELLKHGAHVDVFYHCPHHPEGSVSELAVECDCRKPAPGMLLKAFDEWPIDAQHSWLIGDKASDLEAAERAGIKALLFDGKDLATVVRRLVESDS